MAIRPSNPAPCTAFPFAPKKKPTEVALCVADVPGWGSVVGLLLLRDGGGKRPIGLTHPD